jgi:hypothetical protein
MCVLVMGSLYAGAGACAPAPAQSTQALGVFVDGFDHQGQPLRNGGAVRLDSNLSAEVFVDPYPATGPSSWLDLYLDRSGQPVTDAAVAADNEMTYMSHGASHQDGRTSGDGHYLFALAYPMVGLWRHRITIQIAEQQYVLPLLITVYPS